MQEATQPTRPTTVEEAYAALRRLNIQLRQADSAVSKAAAEKYASDSMVKTAELSGHPPGPDETWDRREEAARTLTQAKERQTSIVEEKKTLATWISEQHEQDENER